MGEWSVVELAWVGLRVLLRVLAAHRGRLVLIAVKPHNNTFSGRLVKAAVLLPIYY